MLLINFGCAFSSLSSCASCFESTDDKDQKKSQKVLNELENIDDECDQNDIAFVKIDDDKEAEEWGIDEIPTIVKPARIERIAENLVQWYVSVLPLFRYSSNVEFHTFMRVTWWKKMTCSVG